MIALMIQKFESSLKVQRTKGKFSDNPCQNILGLYNVSVKRTLMSSITNLVHELPHELPNDLRLDLQKLRNIRKISNLGGDRV